MHSDSNGVTPGNAPLASTPASNNATLAGASGNMTGSANTATAIVGAGAASASTGLVSATREAKSLRLARHPPPIHWIQVAAMDPQVMGVLGRYFRMSHRQVEDVLTPGRSSSHSHMLLFIVLYFIQCCDRSIAIGGWS
jgi:hypothetical protein